MMNRKEFYEYVKDNVKEYLPESYKDAEITPVSYTHLTGYGRRY